MNSRRDFLKVFGVSAVSLACGTSHRPAGRQPRPQVCTATEDNIEGPFFTAGAPERLVLVRSDDAGERLAMSGSVRGDDCAILAGAIIEVWQADAKGNYDNDGYHFRGKLRTDRDGTWNLATIVPGRYLNGSTYRPAHIHIKIAQAGYQPLTTQLYFPDDPFNAADPFIKPSLVMPIVQSKAGKRGSFDFVLTRAK